MRYFVFSFLFLLNSCSSTSRNDAINEPREEAVNEPNQQAPAGKPGNVKYACEGGAIQCLAERDKTGQVFIKLLCLDPNTNIKLEDVNVIVDEYYMKLLMIVDKQNTGSADSMHIEPLIIGIKPLPVETTSLTGNVISQGPSYQVLM